MSSAKDAELYVGGDTGSEETSRQRTSTEGNSGLFARGTLGIGDFSGRPDKTRGTKSKSSAKRVAEYRRNHVNLILRYVLPKKYRRNDKVARSANTIMDVIEWLDGIGIEASETQVRRDIEAALKQGPLSLLRGGALEGRFHEPARVTAPPP